MSERLRDMMPTTAEVRKRRLWQEMVHWLRIELNSRFGLTLRDHESIRHLEDMAATLINSGELFDKDIQKQLEQIEKSDTQKLFNALGTPVFIKTPPSAAMTPEDVISLYDQLAGINDEIEYCEDGYVRFGSANDADHFREIVREIESRRNALLLPPTGDQK